MTDEEIKKLAQAIDEADIPDSVTKQLLQQLMDAVRNLQWQIMSLGYEIDRIKDPYSQD